MAIGDRFKMGVQGVWCGAPVAFGLEYVQLQPDIPGEPPGKSLIDGWFADSGSPWVQIRSNLSADLSITCVSWSSDSSKGASFLTTNNTGVVTASPSMPTTCNVMMHIRARGPHPGSNPQKPKYYGGRFFMPGLVQADVFRSFLAASARTAWGLFGFLCINIAPAGQTGTMFRLMPFLEFVPNPLGGTGAEITAVHCFPDALIRRLKTRKPNSCQIAGAQGVPPGGLITTPPAPV